MMEENGGILIYQNQGGDIKLDVELEDETVWLTQVQMSQLFSKAVSTISEHIKNIYTEKELSQSNTMRKFGISELSTKPTNFYNLDVIISVGYRVKSQQGTQFRIWAISQQTAAELVYRRADASLPLLGMQSFDQDSSKNITKQQASIAKNYLSEDEMKLLGLLVEQYLAFPETMAQQQTAMTMQDWIARLDVILQLNGRELLTHAGEISAEQAKDKATLELENYRTQQKALQHEQSLNELEADIKRLNHGK